MPEALASPFPQSPTPPRHALLEAKSLSKDYPGVRALDGVDLQLACGEALGLCGENGAGKSTLLKILSGQIPHGQFGGEVIYCGKTLALRGPADALKLGIRIIHQELALAPSLSVTDNLFLGQERLRGGPRLRRFFPWVHADEQREMARAQLDRLGLQQVPLHSPVGHLPVGLQQGVEIARALLGGGELLILDEPTSALSRKETDALLELCLRLKTQGVGLIYVSHKLGEVFHIADKLTVLRNGRSVKTLDAPPFEAADVAAAMVGRSLHEFFPALDPVPSQAAPLLRLDQLRVSVAATGRPVTHGLSLTLRAGEIVGLAGLLGSGRTEILETLFGLPHWSGEGSLAWELEPASSLPRHPRDAMRQGFALLPEDRRRHGLLTALSLRRNHSLAALARYAGPSGWMREAAEYVDSQSSIAKLNIRAAHADVIAGTLSGGNQQKVVLGKWLLTSPKVLLLDDPTRGVDVGAKAEIYRLISELAAQGMAILLASSENEEVLRLSHRIVVLREGHVLGEYPHGKLRQEDLVALCSSPWTPPPLRGAGQEKT